MSAGVGLLEACDDPRLLGFPLWPRQRKLLASIEQGPRVHVLALGRRSGKTTMAALVCLHNALLRPDLDSRVRPGERRYAVGVATNLAQARLLVNAARSIVERSPLLAPLLARASEDELSFSLPSGAQTAVRAFPCSSRGGRGWPISALVMDEAAHFLTETEGHQTAERVWQALMPATAQFGPAGRVIVASTPYGQAGLFSSLYRQADAGELPDAVAHHAPTAAVNPSIDAAFLERERVRDPESFRAEYEAEFLASGSAFLDPERVEAAVDDERFELPPGDLDGAIAALDPAFSQDPFALAIVGRSRAGAESRATGGSGDRRGCLRLACVRSWQPRRGAELSFDPILDEVAEICKRYGVRSVLTDQYASVPVRQGLMRRGLHATEVTMSSSSKTAIYSDLKSKLYAGELELYRHPGLLSELGRIEAHYSAGSASVRIPRVGGSHGDLAQALALAVSKAALRLPGGPSVRQRGGMGRRAWLENGDPSDGDGALGLDPAPRLASLRTRQF